MKQICEQVPHQFAATMMTGSMEPHIRVGEEVTIEKCELKDLKLFDIVVFNDGEKLVSHTVWGFNQIGAANGERTLITRGLTSLEFDFPVRESQIVGKIVSHPLGAWRTMWVRFKVVLSQWV